MFEWSFKKKKKIQTLGRRLIVRIDLNVLKRRERGKKKKALPDLDFQTREHFQVHPVQVDLHRMQASKSRARVLKSRSRNILFFFLMSLRGLHTI